MCRSTSCRDRNDSGHRGHWCSAECVSMCRCSAAFVAKAAGHLVHRMFLLQLCVFTCVVNRLSDLNVCLHSVHSYSLQPTCTTHTLNHFTGKFFVLICYHKFKTCYSVECLLTATLSMHCSQCEQPITPCRKYKPASP